MSDYSSISFKNNGKLKLLIIVGTRPEIIRLAAVINKTRKYFDVILMTSCDGSSGLSGLKLSVALNTAVMAVFFAGMV